MNAKHGLQFYEASHRYKLDGAWVTGVTTALGVVNKPGLTKWAARAVAEYVAANKDAIGHMYSMGYAPMVAALKEVPWQTRKEKAARGTSLHDYAEKILRGEQVEVPEALTGHVASAIAFMEDWKIEPVLIEQCVGSRQHSYGGTLDLVADHSKGPRAIFDWKSGKAIYSSTAFQLAAYGMAEFYGENGDEHPMADLGIEASYGVHIREDGYSAHPLPYGPAILAEFVAILEVFRINKRAEGDWRTPGSGYVGLPVGAEAFA